MTSLTPMDLQIVAVAIGFLISGSFMRIVWKSAKTADTPKQRPPNA